MKNSAVHFSEIRLTPRLKQNVRAARIRYQLHLEDQRKLTAESEKARKRKAVQDKIRSVESKRKLLKESVASMSRILKFEELLYLEPDPDSKILEQERSRSLKK